MLDSFMLCRVMMSAARVVVMVLLGERRGRKHQQKQRSCKKLFHGLNVTRSCKKR